jgi:hypothetical protein
MKICNNIKLICLTSIIFFSINACNTVSPSNQSGNPPYTIQITNPDSYVDSGILDIAICENEAGFLKPDEAFLAVQAIKNNQWDSSLPGAGTYGDYLVKYLYSQEYVVSTYSDEKAASKAGISDARVEINRWEFSREQSTSSGCPMLPVRAFVQSGDWRNFGKCPFDKVIVIAYYQGKNISQISFPCNPSSKSSQCSWATLIIGTWANNNPERTDYATFFEDGVAHSYNTDNNNNIISDHKWNWECCENGTINSSAGCPGVTIQIPNSNTLIWNNDQWTREHP